MIFIERMRNVLDERIEQGRSNLETNPSERNAGMVKGLRTARELLDDEYKRIVGEDSRTEG